MKKQEPKIYQFVYICPICCEDAFFIEKRLRLENRIIHVKDVMHLIAWEDGIPAKAEDVACQRCKGRLRLVDPDRIESLRRPWVVPPKE